MSKRVMVKIQKVISKGERLRIERLLKYIAKASSRESILLYGNAAQFYLFTRPLIRKMAQMYNLSAKEIEVIINPKKKENKHAKKKS